MTEQRQPKDPPLAEQKPDLAHAPNGIPHGAEDAEAKGAPHSDRQKSETAAKKP